MVIPTGSAPLPGVCRGRWRAAGSRTMCANSLVEWWDIGDDVRSRRERSVQSPCRRVRNVAAVDPSPYSMRLALALCLSVVLMACSRTVLTAPTPTPTARGTGQSASPRLATVDALLPAPPAAVGMDPDLPARLDSLVRVAMDEGMSPGAAIAVGRYGRLIHLKGYGTLDYAPGSPAVDPTTLYDMASLTKVVATTTAAMILEEEGKLDISRTVHSYVPELDAPDKAGITVRQILTHRGGFEAFAPLHRQYRGRAEYLTQINARPLTSVPGTHMVYSDWDFILMQAVIERITGTTLDAFVASRVFTPLHMTSARFTPDTADATLLRHIAVTANDTLRGL